MNVTDNHNGVATRASVTLDETIILYWDYSPIYHVNPHLRVLETTYAVLWGQCGNSVRTMVIEWSTESFEKRHNICPTPIYYIRE